MVAEHEKKSEDAENGGSAGRGRWGDGSVEGDGVDDPDAEGEDDFGAWRASGRPSWVWEVLKNDGHAGDHADGE